jgi:hypothetical protein
MTRNRKIVVSVGVVLLVVVVGRIVWATCFTPSVTPMAKNVVVADPVAVAAAEENARLKAENEALRNQAKRAQQPPAELKAEAPDPTLGDNRKFTADKLGVKWMDLVTEEGRQRRLKVVVSERGGPILFHPNEVPPQVELEEGESLAYCNIDTRRSVEEKPTFRSVWIVVPAREKE